MERRVTTLPPLEAMDIGLPLGALNSISQGFAITRTQGRTVQIVYCNAALEEMLNIGHEDLAGASHPFLDANAIPLDAQRSIRAALSGDTTLRTTVNYVRRDGIPCWIALSLYPMKPPHKGALHHVWVHEDSGHRVASEELWMRYEAIVNSSKEFMALIGRDYTIALASTSLCHAVGYAPENLVGGQLRAVWGEKEFESQLRPYLDRCFAGDTGRHRDYIHLPNALGQFHEMTFYPFSSKGTEVTHAVFISRNITALKESEDALRQLNQELEQRVRERTAELNALLKDMESFNYTIAHDLRAPLRFVNAFARMLGQTAGDQLSPECHEYLDNIQEGVRQMDKLIAALLDFARSGSRPLTRRRVDIAKLVSEVAAELQQDERNARVSVRIDPLPQTTCDAALLKQVFVNLLGNAMKYSRSRDDAAVEVGMTVENSERVYYVKDNGCGFDMRYADEIFGVFKRLSVQDNIEGSGVGLSIVKRIIERHGGRVWAESAPGNGATFKFTLSAHVMTAAQGN